MSENEAVQPKPYRIWHTATTFRKNGSPVMGSLGASIGDVIVMRRAEFLRLVREVPALATVEFEIGEEV